MAELIEKRTRNSKTHSLGGNKFAWDGTIGSAHYQDAQGNWQDIDNGWVAAAPPWDWYMEKDGYHTYVLENFTAGQVLKFESQGSQVAFQPMELQWTNDLNQIQSISIPQNVPVSVTNEPVELLPGMSGSVGKIRWNNGYGLGRHFEWVNTPGRLSKLLQLDTAPPAPPQFIVDGGNPALRLNFIFSPDSDLDIIVDGQTWDKSSKKQTVGRVEFWKKGSIVWVFNPLRYWDSSGNGESLAGTTELRKVGNSLYISSLVPYSWLQTATYPVFIDPTVELFPNHFRYFHTEAWNGDKKWIQDAVDGVTPASSSSSALNSTGNFLIQGFQTEPINETTLSAGHWGFYLWGKHDGTTLKASLFVQVRKNSSSGQLLAASGYTPNLTTAETEYYTYLDFPETAWISGDTVWVGVYTNVTVKQNGKKAYFYYDHTSRESRVLNPTIDVQVGVTADDGYFDGSTLYNSAVWIGLYGGSIEDAWYRWTGVTIPVGATIGANTYVSLDAGYKDGTITNVHTRLYFNDVSAPVVPTTRADYDAKAVTTNFKDFDPTAWVTNTWYNIDASSIIAELVASYDYSSGAAMMALHKDDGSTVDSDINVWDYGVDTTKAAKLHIEYTAGGAGYKDIATHFKLWVRSFKDIATRFRLWALGYKDIPTRFKLWVGAYQDIATRFKIEVQGFQDAATRFKLWATSFQDIATRFKLEVRGFQDATTRFKLFGLSYQDVAARFRLAVQGFQDTATRFKLTVGTLAYKDATTRFKLWVANFQDAATRFKLEVQGYLDVATRFKLFGISYQDAVTRFKLEVQNFQDAYARFKLEVQNFQDIATRFRLNLGFYRDVATRFVLESASYQDAVTRFKLWATSFRDATTRFVLSVREYQDIATRFGLRVQGYMDTATRFRLWVTSYLDVTTRFKLGVQGFQDAATRFRLSVQNYTDIATRFKLSVQGYQDIVTRFRLWATNYQDASTRFNLTVSGYTDVGTRFQVVIVADLYPFGVLPGHRL